jgi:hypothetical protein
VSAVRSGSVYGAPTTLSTKTIHDFLSDKAVDLTALTIFLDADQHIRHIRSLTRAEQVLLFEAAANVRALKLTDLVPEGTPLLHEVIYQERNSFPIMRFFEKRFCLLRMHTDELWGYNKHILKPLIGPGYFIARQHSTFEVMIDYTEVPPSKPPAWLRILPNLARLGRFVHEGLRDIVRGVSKHVSIGRATREGQPGDNWFVLCRDESQTAKRASE